MKKGDGAQHHPGRAGRKSNNQAHSSNALSLDLSSILKMIDINIFSKDWSDSMHPMRIRIINEITSLVDQTPYMFEKERSTSHSIYYQQENIAFILIFTPSYNNPVTSYHHKTMFNQWLKRKERNTRKKEAVSLLRYTRKKLLMQQQQKTLFLNKPKTHYSESSFVLVSAFGNWLTSIIVFSAETSSGTCRGSKESTMSRIRGLAFGFRFKQW